MDYATDFDRSVMRRAITLAQGMLGLVWPNPAVGCILVKDGAVIAEGVTQPGGRPHAETMALRAAGERARGATAYVSLEPCSSTRMLRSLVKPGSPSKVIVSTMSAVYFTS